MLVKICGLKTKEAARIASEAGADFLGFIFAESSRKVSAETVAAIGKEIPSHVKKVGVFLHQSEEEIKQIAEAANLDYIQLHGEEDAEFAKRMPLPVIKAFSIKTKDDYAKLRSYPAEYYLVDLPKKGANQKTLDWDELKRENVPFDKLLLAGGLTPNNVKEAIEIVGPLGVDVASGVETEGVKDERKIHAFIRAAKSLEE